jgi:UPF0271 protein
VPDEARTVDLNADVGEADDAAGVARERELLSLVTSCHVACGGHAGDEASMRATVRAALAVGTSVGAHPSYPDRTGFGRRPVAMDRIELAASLDAQIAALQHVAEEEGTSLTSLKAHGALYGEVAAGGDTCALLLEVMAARCAPEVALVLPSGAAATAQVQAAGRPVVHEGFADRAYRADGGLVERSVPGAVFDDPAVAAAQALRLVVEGAVTAVDGTELAAHIDTLCLHGDTPHAPALARAVRQALAERGIAVGAPLPRG